MLINSFTDEGKNIGIKMDHSSETLALILSYLLLSFLLLLIPFITRLYITSGETQAWLLV